MYWYDFDDPQKEEDDPYEGDWISDTEYSSAGGGT
jgi:hypothetical protein